MVASQRTSDCADASWRVIVTLHGHPSPVAFALTGVPLGYSHDHLDLVVDALDHAGVQTPAAVREDPVQSLLERLGELDQRRDATVDRSAAPLLPGSLGGVASPKRI